MSGAGPSLWPTLVAGFLLGVSVAAPVGPVSLMAIRSGLRDGWPAALGVGLGAASVDFVYMGLTYLGVTPVLARVAWLPVALYLGGALLLGRMGWTALRDRPSAGAGLALGAGEGGTTPAAAAPTLAAARPLTFPRAFLLGLGITIVNPATIMLWLTLGAAFSAAALAGLPPLRALAVILSIVAGSAGWFVGLSAVIGALRGAFERRAGWMAGVDLGAGLTLLGFAVVFGYRGVLGLVRLIVA